MRAKTASAAARNAATHLCHGLIFTDAAPYNDHDNVDVASLPRDRGR